MSKKKRTKGDSVAARHMELESVTQWANNLQAIIQDVSEISMKLAELLSTPKRKGDADTIERPVLQLIKKLKEHQRELDRLNQHFSDKHMIELMESCQQAHLLINKLIYVEPELLAKSKISPSFSVSLKTPAHSLSKVTSKADKSIDVEVSAAKKPSKR